ncbi:MAG: aminotransferase class V-fold PLP-dependent enzyme [Actinomycetes bacterium]
MAYLDAGSSQRLNEAGRHALEQALDQGWADPVRLHSQGRKSALLAEQSISTIAQVLKVQRDEVHILPSGTHAAHAAITGTAYARRRVDSPAIISAVEHSCVINATAALSQCQSLQLGVDQFGLIDPEELEATLRESGARFVAVQSVNQETGTTQDVQAIAQLCSAAEVPYIVDASQSIGHEQTPQSFDALIASAHKWGGPVGVGLLILRTGTPWHPTSLTQTLGVFGQGFPNVPVLAATAASLVQADQERTSNRDRLMTLTEKIRAHAATLDGVEVLGHPTQRAAHLVTINVPLIAGDVIVEHLDRLGVAVASGSACSSSPLDPSHVLLAMGIQTYGNVRVGLSHTTTEADVDEFLSCLPRALEAIRATSAY